MSLSLRPRGAGGQRRQPEAERGPGRTRSLHGEEATPRKVPHTQLGTVFVEARGFIITFAFRNYSTKKYSLLVCLLSFILFFFPPLFSVVLSYIPFPPLFLRDTLYTTLPINSFRISAIPTEDSAFTPWVNPSGPAPALGQRLLQPFPSAGDRHHRQSSLASSVVRRFSSACCCRPSKRGLGQSGVVAALTALSFTTEEGEGTEMHPHTCLTTCILPQSFTSSHASSHVPCMGALIVIICIYSMLSHLLGSVCLLQ